MKTLYVVGLGPGNLDMIPVRNLKILQNISPLYLRTERHPAANELEEQGIDFTSFDDCYEQHQTFENVYETIVDKLFASLAHHKEIVYAVPGHPFVAEATVKIIKERAAKENIELIIAPAMSCLDAIYNVLGLDPTSGILIKDALSLESNDLLLETGLLITQLYNRQTASDVKLSLMEVYPEEHQVTLVQGASIPGLEQIKTIPLYELDRVHWIDHLTSLYVTPLTITQVSGQYDLNKFIKIMQELLGEQGCPWDKEQNHQTLKKYLIEECYEVVEAIEEQDMYKLCDELGDLLLQIVFHAELAKRAGYFNMNDVITAVSEKMIRRHPHVFGHVEVENAGEVLVNWEAIKEEEKRKQGQSLKLQVPRGLPALQRAQKIQKKAAKVGFDWQDLKGPKQKLNEELKELEKVIEEKDFAGMKEELGDVLFTVVNIARFLDVEAEEALSDTNNKFLRRFAHMEEEAERQNCQLSSLTMEELDKLWNNAKEKP
jgi:tetrapyrrole methylase family protein/MazG family protein